MLCEILNIQTPSLIKIVLGYEGESSTKEVEDKESINYVEEVK